MKYALFRWVEKEDKVSHTVSVFSVDWYSDDSGDWKKSEDSTKEKKKEKKLKFVAFLKSPKDVAGIVRKNPLWDYVLFSGEISGVKVAMPVFVGGKNLDTMDSEWA